MAPCNGTQQMAPRPLPKVGRHPPPTTIAHYNGTQQWHHVHSPKVGRHPPLQWHPTMAQQWHRVLWPCNGTLVPRPIRQSGSSPSPVLEVNPYSYRYLGNEWIGIVYLVGKFSKLKQILGVTHNPTVTYDFAKS